MGSPYCEHLKNKTGLKYAFSLNLSDGRPTIAAGFVFRLHLPDYTTRKNNFSLVNSICFDTGATHTAIGITSISRLLTRLLRPEGLVNPTRAFTNQESWDWLKAQKLKQVSVSSILSKALAQDFNSQQKVISKPIQKNIVSPTSSISDSVSAFVLPILLTFPHEKKFAYRINARILNVDSRKFLLSPYDVHHSFAVLIDHALRNDTDNPCKIRFFGTPETELRRLDHWNAIGALDDID